MGVGGRLASFPPAWGIRGPAGRDLDAGAVTAMVDDLRSLRAARIVVRIDPVDQPSWQHLGGDTLVRVARRVHVLDLDPDADRQLAGAQQTTQRTIRRALRPASGVEVRVARAKEQFGARPVEYDEYRFERLPFTAVDNAACGLVKRAIGFKD